MKTLDDMETEFQADLCHRTRKFEHKISLPFSRMYYPRKYFREDLEHLLNKRQFDYISAVIRRLRNDRHYCIATQAQLAAGCKKKDRSIRMAQRELIDKGIIVVKHQYRSTKTNKNRPTRKASIVWLSDFSKKFAYGFDNVNYDAVDPLELIDRVSPEMRTILSNKLPPFAVNRTGKKQPIVQAKNAPCSFIDNIEDRHQGDEYPDYDTYEPDDDCVFVEWPE